MMPKLDTALTAGREVVECTPRFQVRRRIILYDHNVYEYAGQLPELAGVMR
jgi:hypothetical protein